MKTDLLVLAGTVLLFASLPMVSHAEDEDDWATHSPLAFGEPMDDCDLHHPDVAIAVPPAPDLVVPVEKVEAILTTPDVVPAVAPVAIPGATPAAVIPVAVPAKAPPESTTQLSPPRTLSAATLLTFALIASPGTSLPQTSSAGRD